MNPSHLVNKGMDMKMVQFMNINLTILEGAWLPN